MSYNGSSSRMVQHDFDIFTKKKKACFLLVNLFINYKFTKNKNNFHNQIKAAWLPLGSGLFLHPCLQLRLQTALLHIWRIFSHFFPWHPRFPSTDEGKRRSGDHSHELQTIFHWGDKMSKKALACTPEKKAERQCFTIYVVEFHNNLLQ